MKIVTTSHVQKNIGILSDNTQTYTVINRGKPKTIIIPYSEEIQGFLDEYIEDMNIHSNKIELKKKWQNSVDSGLSNLVI